jgi:pseudo-response regulator 5
MLKGAADYLVKPLRRNELRNLWQHVWRRQTSLAPDSFPWNESVGQQKAEGASANNSNGKRDDHVVSGNGGDAQSSCTRPEMEGESADVEVSARDAVQMECAKSQFNETRLLANELQSKQAEAIDFMGASFRRTGRRNREESVAQYESRIELDLSLRRPNASENQSSGDRPSLHPSSASAFTR